MKNNEGRPDDSGRFLSTDCVDFWFDGPGDHTVRPVPAHRLAQVKAEHEKILAAEAEEAKRKKTRKKGRKS